MHLIFPSHTDRARLLTALGVSNCSRLIREALNTKPKGDKRLQRIDLDRVRVRNSSARRALPALCSLSLLLRLVYASDPYTL